MLEDQLNFIDNTIADINNNEELLKLSEMENDKEMIEYIQKSLSDLINVLEKKEIESFLSGPHDSKDCYLEIHTGAGGEDASDWSQMLLNMYINCLRGSELSSFEVTLEDTSFKETGIRSALLFISGRYAYGYLKHEQGVHRLVRLSPFNADVSIQY
ncbi:predicted protein [Naegleria gruberi]|uniref:Predicted protein n=1 Tax=Naegleria gruberi TaxID=5762 RepID=D2VLD3_NAEGR|nr:uncharacterized protein NAEGRDRAFT_69739 [Naegleria gruberi]EFC42368.1 predicted protein [Naegleria gruberi]|eukprot:XP_002675112.1 predicted protein [Naegleria gruberi strain NEG-M]